MYKNIRFISFKMSVNRILLSNSDFPTYLDIDPMYPIPDLQGEKIVGIKVFLDYYLKYEDEFLHHCDTIKSITIYNRYTQGTEYLAIGISDQKSKIPKTYKVLESIEFLDGFVNKSKLYFDLLIESNTPSLKKLDLGRGVILKTCLFSEKQPAFYPHFSLHYDTMALRDYFVFRNIRFNHDEFFDHYFSYNVLLNFSKNTDSEKIKNQIIEEKINPSVITLDDRQPQIEPDVDVRKLLWKLFEGDKSSKATIFYGYDKKVERVGDINIRDTRSTPLNSDFRNKISFEINGQIFSIYYVGDKFPQFSENIKLLEIKIDLNYYLTHEKEFLKHAGTIKNINFFNTSPVSVYSNKSLVLRIGKNGYGSLLTVNFLPSVNIPRGFPVEIIHELKSFGQPYSIILWPSTVFKLTGNVSEGFFRFSSSILTDAFMSVKNFYTIKGRKLPDLKNTDKIYNCSFLEKLLDKTATEIDTELEKKENDIYLYDPSKFEETNFLQKFTNKFKLFS